MRQVFASPNDHRFKDKIFKSRSVGLRSWLDVVAFFRCQLINEGSSVGSVHHLETTLMNVDIFTNISYNLTVKLRVFNKILYLSAPSLREAETK